MRSRNPLPAEQRRAVTVEAVLDLAGRQNPADITTAAIAQHMNLTQGALFRHFPTKDALWEAVMQWVADRLLRRIDEAAAVADTPLGALRAVFMAHAEFVVEHPGVPRMLFGELQRAQASPAKILAQILLRRYAERLSRLIDAGKAAGEISDTLDTDAAALLFIGTLQGLIMQSMLAGDLPVIRQQAPRVFALYRRGVEARP